MSNEFSNLNIIPPILQALEEMGFEEPTEVQARAIPHILNKEDIIVKSKTGSGKTAVFGVSMLQLIDPALPGPQGLILTPTRELAVQVDNDLKKMARHLPHKTTAVYGQHSMNTEIQALSRGVTIVTGTPGRVFDHINQGNLKTRHISFLVIDEADRMLDMGFLDQVVKIIRTIPKERVTLLFSATMPAEISRICRAYMNNPSTIEIESQTMTVDTIQQVYYRVEEKEKCRQLNRLLLAERPESCIIFCNTKISVDRVQSFLSRKGYSSHALHGDIPQGKRMATVQMFKQDKFHILVATDVAARGLHIDDLAMVINYDVPVEKDSYVHRIGRTGRAGNSGRAVTLVTSDDIMSLYEIEEHIGVMIEEAELPAEDDLNEHKAEAEEWVRKNSKKDEEPLLVSGKSSRTTKSRKSAGHKPAANKYAKAGTAGPVSVNPKEAAARGAGDNNKAARKNRTGTGTGTGAGTGAGNRSDRAYETGSPARSNVSRKPGAGQTSGSKHAAANPGRSADHGSNAGTYGRTGSSRQNYKKTQSASSNTAGKIPQRDEAASTAKKSLFKRIISKIFGR